MILSLNQGTGLSFDKKKGKIRANINVPERKKPAKFTLHNPSGTPIKDQVVSGTKRSLVMDVSDLRDGVYLCTLSNAGMTSEAREVVLATD